ncbi:MAG: signal peptide peptidase SppA [Bacteroidota bacterium]|mgnify:CR=1 FL=1|jgi:protease-4|nr:signal peptide peptidase SppA [Bacteroidia bacterium]MBP7436151.1 signal peptide peptidase SppA [Bacteroidia bacterium]MBP7728887.1 signal peptide peptidase SppA [Bacteroidia bacterium]MBP7771522.1 signal peptide peptidase SppA [Bacteroidia bacterium]
MRDFFKYFLASVLGFVVGTIVLFFLFLGIVSLLVSSLQSDTEVTVRDKSVVEIRLQYPVKERSSKNPFESFDYDAFESRQELGLHDILRNIDKARRDERIKGIFLNLSSLSMGIATLDEIRGALSEFRKSGKFIYAYADSYSQGAYYLASVANTVAVNPEGGVELRGLHTELMFFKGALDKLGIEPEVIRHGKFKSAIEPFTLDKMSPENREQISRLLGSVWNTWLGNISADRKLPKEELQAIADQYRSRKAKDALDLRLIDKTAYFDEVTDDLRKQCGLEEKEKVRYVELQKYNKAYVKPEKEFSNRKIAVVYAVGEIRSGQGSDEVIGSERISEAIRKARLDTTVKAIVLRVNSPGGSALASEVIWREALLARKAKPLVVSMGDLAASGGYYISCIADTIVAQANTLTGSIGVFGLLFNTQNMWKDKLGITFDTVRTGRFADIGSLSRPLTAEERAIYQEEVEQIYNVFIGHVAEGRNMTTAAVDSIGQGRIWSGTDAKQIGLVDVIGGLETAKSIAAKMAGLDNYRTVNYPEQKEFLQKLMEDFSADAKAYFAKEELGESYRYYAKLREVLNSQGIQARLPYELFIY